MALLLRQRLLELLLCDVSDVGVVCPSVELLNQKVNMGLKSGVFLLQLEVSLTFISLFWLVELLAPLGC